MTTKQFPSNSQKFGPVTSIAALLLIWAAVILCIWPGMHSPLFTDDIHQIGLTKFQTKWTDIFKIDSFGYYRPVKNAIFMIAEPLKENLVAWHWIGLGAYLAAIAGVFRIAAICLRSTPAAWLAACIWALSPSCVSTALWLSCANISTGLVFAALIFHFHERWAELSSYAGAAACMVFYALALLCYESLIAVPGLLFLLDLSRNRLSFKSASIVRYTSYTLVAIAFLIVRHQFSANAIGVHELHAGLAPDTTALHLSLSSPWFLWRHFLMWIFPFGTIEVLGSYAWMRSASPAALAFGWVFLICLLATAALTWKRLPMLAYGLLFFIVASIPSGNFIPNFNGPINDAYVTIPSIGLAIAFIAICEFLLSQFLQRRREAEAGSLILALVLLILAIYRLPVCGAYFRYWAAVWSNPVELMLLTAQTRPYQFQPKGAASNELFVKRYIDQAEIIASEVIAEAPWELTARLTIAQVAQYRGDTALSEQGYRFILDTKSRSGFVRNAATVGLAEMLANDPTRRDDAAALLRGFLKDPRAGGHSRGVAILSRIYQDEGNTEKARETIKRGLKLHPDDVVLNGMLIKLVGGKPNPTGEIH